MTHALATRADNPDHPYGDVTYADPGYQKDGKARYPLDSEEHCRAAWSFIHQPDNAALYTAKQLRKIEDRIRTAGKDYGVDFTDEETDEPSGPEEDDPMPMGRRSYGALGPEILRFERSWPLEDIFIQRGGDGRTVTAYAAIWDTPAEVRDQHGHYIEEIDRASFNRDIARSRPQGGRDYWLTNVFYNHGADLSGKPNGLLSVPLGSPQDIKPDAKGLLTVTRYNKSELADGVLEAIRNGDIRSQSFRGRIFKSTPDRMPTRSRDGALPTIRRTELGLSEYGPTPSAVYEGAAILAVRATQVANSLASLGPAERAELIRMLSTGTPSSDLPAESVASIQELDDEDSPSLGRSVRSQTDIARRIAVARILGEIT
jgi:phage head maturation protease